LDWRDRKNYNAAGYGGIIGGTVKKRLHRAMITFLLFVNCGSLLLACGDKFIVPTRGSRSQRPAAPRSPAAVLIYDSGSDLQRGLAGSSVSDTLSKAGFRPTIVATANEFERELRQGPWDAVIVGIADAPFVSSRLRDDARTPVVIAVLFNPTDAQVKESRKQYRLLRLPAKNQAFLSAIDKALEHRPKSAKSL
jgi:hypothetical protein